MCCPCLPCLGCMPMLCSAGSRANKTSGGTDVGNAFSTEFKLMTKRTKTHQKVYMKTPEELAAEAEAAEAVEASKKSHRLSFGRSTKPALGAEASSSPAPSSSAAPAPALSASSPRAAPLAGQLSKRKKKESKDTRDSKARLEALVGSKPAATAKHSRLGGRLG